MRATYTNVMITCDICGERDVGEPEIVSVNGVSCDICYECYGCFKRDVGFLRKFCGLEISYQAEAKE